METNHGANTAHKAPDLDVRFQMRLVGKSIRVSKNRCGFPFGSIPPFFFRFFRAVSMIYRTFNINPHLLSPLRHRPSLRIEELRQVL